MGMAALQTEIMQKSWLGRRRPPTCATSRVAQLALQLLRASLGRCIYPDEVADVAAALRGLSAGACPARAAAEDVYKEAMVFLEARGVGTLLDSGAGEVAVLAKWHHSVLAPGALEFLQSGGIPLITFCGGKLVAAESLRGCEEADAWPATGAHSGVMVAVEPAQAVAADTDVRSPMVPPRMMHQGVVR